MAALAGHAFGCAPPIEPQIASSAGESVYATAYPSELQAATDEINSAESKTKDLCGKFAGLPDALKSPAWDKVGGVVERADEEGRAYAYVEARREVDDAYFFFDSEKDEIIKKVSGAAAFSAKQQKGQEVDLSGAVAHAFKDTVEKRLEKRLRARSEAHALIDRNATALGKDNVEKLEDTADQIALSSYLSHVKIVEDKLRLRRMILESEAIKKTLDDALRAEQAYQAEPSHTPAEKKASEERAEATRKAQGTVDSAVTQAKSVSERADERLAAVAKIHDDAVAKLREDVKKRSGK